MKKAPLVAIVVTALSVSATPVTVQAHTTDASRISNSASERSFVLATYSDDELATEETTEETSSGMTAVGQVWNYLLGIVALGSMLAILGQAVHMSGVLDSLLASFR